MIDLRSDTVTRPTPEMRRAMAEAEVGDDVYGEDPTVNRLQELSAGRLGFEAALLVPSGVMGNEIAIRVLTRPGQEVLADDRSHVVGIATARPAGEIVCMTLHSQGTPGRGAASVARPRSTYFFNSSALPT